jgi:hypothetical protein
MIRWLARVALIGFWLLLYFGLNLLYFRSRS